MFEKAEFSTISNREPDDPDAAARAQLGEVVAARQERARQLAEALAAADAQARRDALASPEARATASRHAVEDEAAGIYAAGAELAVDTLYDREASRLQKRDAVADSIRLKAQMLRSQNVNGATGARA